MGLKRRSAKSGLWTGSASLSPAGAVTALIGPNGSGKTTLLLLLTGLLKADAGKAIIAGHDVESHNLKARACVGWMPDSFGTWDALTCTEILTTFAHAYGIPAPTATRWSTTCSTGAPAGVRLPSSRVLSRGQKQRLDWPAPSSTTPRCCCSTNRRPVSTPAHGSNFACCVSLRVRARRSWSRPTCFPNSRSCTTTPCSSPGTDGGRVRFGRFVRDGATRVAAGRDRSGRAAHLHDAAGIPWAGQSNGEVIVQLSGYDSARELVRAAVAADVSLHTISPVSGRLEEAYLSLNEERV